jgi:hypothetical protein
VRPLHNLFRILNPNFIISWVVPTGLHKMWFIRYPGFSRPFGTQHPGLQLDHPACAGFRFLVWRFGINYIRDMGLPRFIKIPSGITIGSSSYKKIMSRIKHFYGSQLIINQFVSCQYSIKFSFYNPEPRLGGVAQL